MQMLDVALNCSDYQECANIKMLHYYHHNNFIPFPYNLLLCHCNEVTALMNSFLFSWRDNSVAIICFRWLFPLMETEFLSMITISYVVNISDFCIVIINIDLVNIN